MWEALQQAKSSRNSQTNLSIDMISQSIFKKKHKKTPCQNHHLVVLPPTCQEVLHKPRMPVSRLMASPCLCLSSRYVAGGLYGGAEQSAQRRFPMEDPSMSFSWSGWIFQESLRPLTKGKKEYDFLHTELQENVNNHNPSTLFGTQYSFFLLPGLVPVELLQLSSGVASTRQKV